MRPGSPGSSDSMTAPRRSTKNADTSLVRSPGYTLTAIVVIAAAVAANATVLSFVRGTLLYEPPWSEPDRVVAVWGSNTVDGQLRDVISGPNFIDMERESRTLESMAAFHFGGTAMMVDGRMSQKGNGTGFFEEFKPF